MSLLLLTTLALVLTDADHQELEPLLRNGMAALRAGKTEEALALAKLAVALAPQEPRAYLLCGSVQATLRQHSEAIADFSQCIQLDATIADAWQRRGEEHFRRAEIDAS